MSDLQTAFDKLIEEQNELTKRFQETAQSLFKETTKEFFAKNPGVTAVVWTQYTPYFNDGEACEFSVHEPYFTNATAEQFEDISNWGEYDGDDETVWSETDWILCGDSDYCKERRGNMKLDGIDSATIQHFSKMIQSSEMEDVMEAMFGDHVRIVATREGFEVDDYSHD